MKTHEQLYQEARDALDRLYEDESVCIYHTITDLMALRVRIGTLIETIREDEEE
jgi:hypothetical protein